MVSGGGLEDLWCMCKRERESLLFGAQKTSTGVSVGETCCCCRGQRHDALVPFRTCQSPTREEPITYVMVSHQSLITRSEVDVSTPILQLKKLGFRDSVTEGYTAR